MTYTSIGISEELKKELSLLKLTEDKKTFEDLLKILIENYKEVNSVSTNKTNA